VLAGFFLLPLMQAQAAIGAPPTAEKSAESGPTLVVRVTADNKPVAGAQVSAFLLHDIHTVLTDGDGLARVTLPAGGKVNGLSTIHPQLGMGAVWFGFPTKPPTAGGRFPLELTPPGPHTVRVVDPDGKPVPHVRCVVEDVGWPKQRSMSARGLEAAHFETDGEGEARLAWMPRDADRLIARPVDDERWKMDGCDTADGNFTVHVRRLEAVNGRVRVPGGVAAEGLTISADGMHESGWRHDTKARVRRDGSFTINLAPGDAYAVQLTDSKWASDAWTGVVPRDGEPPAIVLEAYPATPLSVRVTRGPGHEPIADTWINLSSLHEVFWNSGRGRSMVMQPGIRTGLYTDATGTARLFVGKGKHAVFFALKGWHEERPVTVTSSRPVLVEVDRPSNDN
jgi:hypothetical protein